MFLRSNNFIIGIKAHRHNSDHLLNTWFPRTDASWHGNRYELRDSLGVYGKSTNGLANWYKSQDQRQSGAKLLAAAASVLRFLVRGSAQRQVFELTPTHHHPHPHRPTPTQVPTSRMYIVWSPPPLHASNMTTLYIVM